MNVSFKTIRRSGDKVYILSEISGYDERLPVVLVASTESGARIPSDTFPYCDVADPLALRQVLSDGALANREMPFPPLHTKNSAGVRFFVIALPWLSIRRWELEFRAIDSSGNVITSCRKSLDVRATSLKAMASQRNDASASLIEDLDGRFIHDRIRVSFLRAFETGGKIRVSALLEMPYHEASVVECDFLDKAGHPLDIRPDVVEDSISQSAGFGSSQRRYVELSFLVDAANPQVCLCATDTASTIAPGFAMLGNRTLEGLLDEFEEETTSAALDPEYHEWFVEEHRADVPALLEQVATRFDYEPLFSIVCVLADTPSHHIHDLLNSIALQSYGHWELILVDAGSSGAEAADLKNAIDSDRVYVVETDPALGINERFAAGMATVEGDFVVFMKPCDVMAPDTLFECVRTINEYPDCDVIYTDVDAFDAEGVHFQPVFRPDFSPELLRSYNYVRDLVVVRPSLLMGMKNLPHAILGAAGYDLSLRITEKARRVCHVPRVLCHRRFATIDTSEGFRATQIEQEEGRKALVAHCQRVGINAEVLNANAPGHYRVRHVLTETPHVSVVLIFEGNAPMLRTCVRDLYEKISYANFEVVVVSAVKTSEAAKACLAELEESYETLSVLSWDGPLNKAKIANFAAAHTEGEFLLFLNDDARILTDDALEVLLGYFQRPDVGVVGPKQLFIDGTVEHAGIVVGGTRVVTPLFRHMDAESQGYLDRAVVAQNVSAVTGDCMMLRRSIFEEVGGFSEEFTLYYADVDFCLKAKSAGYYTVFTPYVLLSHLHSVSRMRIRSKELSIRRRREAALLQSAWPRIFVEGDSFYNPNLNHDSSYFAMKRGKSRG